MTVLEKIENSRVLFVLINLFAGGYFLLINRLTPLAGDDLGYRYIFQTDELVTNLSDVLRSQCIHYRTWGGRFIVHAIDQYFLAHDKIFFDFANTVVFLALVFLIYYVQV